jgi:hypothetical protein
LYVLRNLELIIPEVCTKLMLLAYTSYLEGVEDFSLEVGGLTAKLESHLSLDHVEQRP